MVLFVDGGLPFGTYNLTLGLLVEKATDGAAEKLHGLTRGRSGRVTMGADIAYDTRDFVSTVRELGVRPHVARRQNGRSTSERAGIRVTRSVSANAGW